MTKHPGRFKSGRLAGKTPLEVEELWLESAIEGAPRELKALLDTDLTPQQREVVHYLKSYVFVLTSFLLEHYTGKLTGNQHRANKPNTSRTAALSTAREYQPLGLSQRALAKKVRRRLVELLGKKKAPPTNTIRYWLRQSPAKKVDGFI